MKRENKLAISKVSKLPKKNKEGDIDRDISLAKNYIDRDIFMAKNDIDRDISSSENDIDRDISLSKNYIDREGIFEEAREVL